MSRFAAMCLVLLGLLVRVEAAPLFLLLDGIPGESPAARHLGWIELSDFENALERPAEAARSTYKPLVFRKRIDKSSPLLMLACASGRPIAQATFDQLRTEDSGVRFLQVKLRNVLVTSYQHSRGAAALPTEEFSLNFTEITWTYTQIDARGQALRSITSSWDLAADTGTGAAPPPDGDNDGLPDEYETRYGLNPEVSDADLDLDEDGLSNVDEFRAGTLPSQKDSVFRAEGARVDDGRILLRWNSAPERTYRILGAASPDGPFEFVRLAEPATPGDAELEIETTAAHRFFVVEVE